MNHEEGYVNAQIKMKALVVSRLLLATSPIGELLRTNGRRLAR
jgi:hypothetical protein